MLENVKKDIRRYMLTDNETPGIRGVFDLVLFNYSLWVILSYRFGVWVREHCRVPLVRQVLKLATRISHNLLGLLTGIQIPFEAQIGPGLYIGHTGMLVLNSNTIIGENCNIGIGVIIGYGGRGDRSGCPRIGNNVFIGVGAKVIGNITVGDKAAIGANAVVTSDIPANATAVGVPARVVNYRGSDDFVKV
ncbi:MAG: serine acetyltransferase [Candidatus Omnitrophota bacterium]